MNQLPPALHYHKNHQSLPDMKLPNKTPYEIRLEALQLAQLILHEKHKASSTPGYISTSPTTEEVIAEAEKLNRFISNGNSL